MINKVKITNDNGTYFESAIKKRYMVATIPEIILEIDIILVS